MNAFLERLVTAALAFFLGAFLIGGCMGDYYEETAVEVGVAEFYIDADYKKAFRWKTNTAQLKPQ